MKELTPEQLQRWVYPGGEVGVRTQNTPDSIVWRIQNSDDLMALVMACHTKGIKPAFQEVYIPYMPYARQDRIAVQGDPNSIQVLAMILSHCGIQKVTTLDAHSPATKQAFQNYGVEFEDINPRAFINIFLKSIVEKFKTKQIILVCPDKGAIEKTKEYAAGLGIQAIVYCLKERDPNTGKLIRFKVDKLEGINWGIAVQDEVFVIVDDICDGGRSFLGVKQAVVDVYLAGSHMNKTAEQYINFALWTTHGIYSAGFETLEKEFKLIGSTDSFRHGRACPNLITIPIHA